MTKIKFDLSYLDEQKRRTLEILYKHNVQNFNYTKGDLFATGETNNIKDCAIFVKYEVQYLSNYSNEDDVEPGRMDPTIIFKEVYPAPLP